MELAFGSKEQQRENLAKLVGKGIIKFSARITAGRKVGATPMRMLQNIVIYTETETIKIHHLWVEDNLRFRKLEGQFAKFTGKVKFWNFEKTKAGIYSVKLQENFNKNCDKIAS